MLYNKTQIISSFITHELKTPLNAIIGFSDLIIEEESINDIKSFASIIKQNGSQLLDKIHNIIDASYDFNNKDIKIGLIDVVNVLNNIKYRLVKETLLHPDDFEINIICPNPKIEIITDLEIFEQALYLLIKSFVLNSVVHKIRSTIYLQSEQGCQNRYIFCFTNKDCLTVEKCEQFLCDGCLINGWKDFIFQEGLGINLAISEYLFSQIGIKISFNSYEDNINIIFTTPVNKALSPARESFKDIKIVIATEEEDEYNELRSYIAKFQCKVIKTQPCLIENVVTNIPKVKVVITKISSINPSLENMKRLKERYLNTLFIIVIDECIFPNLALLSKYNLNVLSYPVSKNEIENMIDICLEKDYQLQ